MGRLTALALGFFILLLLFGIASSLSHCSYTVSPYASVNPRPSPSPSPTPEKRSGLSEFPVGEHVLVSTAKYDRIRGTIKGDVSRFPGTVFPGGHLLGQDGLDGLVRLRLESG
jgi:hypothetical protein